MNLPHYLITNIL